MGGGGGGGEKEAYIFTHAHQTAKNRFKSTHMHSKDRCEGELGATMKEVCLRE